MNKSLIIIFVTAILAYSALSQKNVFQTKTLYPNVHEIENALPESCVSLLGPQPIPGTAKFLNKKVFGYHPYWMGETYFAYRFDLLSTIAWFSVVPGKDGSFIRMRGWPPMPLISLAHANGVKVVPVIANFNPESLIAILSSASSSDCLIKNIISTISDSNADGVNIDFERLPFSQRDNFVNFISNLTVRLHKELPGKEITVAVPAVDFHTAYDVEKLARITDGLFIMGYAYHYRGSRYTGAVAPFDSGKRNLKSTVLNYIDITKNQRDKLILGLPYYALEWQVNTNLPETKTLSPAVALWFTPAARQAEIYGKNWDEISKTPWYSRTELTNTYQTWFDDAKSLKIKFGLVDEFNLSGGGVWALGYDYGQTDLWNVLENKFGSRGNPSLRFTYDFSPTQEKLRFHINKNDLIENLNVKKKINKNSVEYVFPDPVDITNICVFGGAYDARQFLNFDVSVIQNKQTNFTHLITAYSGSPDVTLVCPTDNLYSAVSVFRDYGPIAKKVTALKLTFHKVGNTNSKTFVNADDATLDSIIRKINISGFAEEENSNAAISPFAINAVKPFHLYHNLDTTGELRFALLKETGAKWDRTDFWWGRIEPEKGKFDFSFPDHVVKTFEKHNISLLPILNYTAAWATNGYAPTSPKELSDFSNYVYKVVKRYPQFSHWEVWNEPNLIHFWKPEPNVNDYTKLLKITAIAARKANPNVKLVGGSLAYSDADYLKKMYQNGAKGSFDVFSYHYYKVTPPEKEVIDELNKIIIVMNRFGDTSTPIWITEMGTSNHPDRGVDEAHQAAYLTRNYFIALSFPRVERIFQFDLMNWTDKRVADGWGRQLGLVRADGTRKISFYAYSNMVARISPRKNSAWRPKRLFSPEWPEDVFVYYYEHNSKPSLIIYSDNTNAAPISIRILTNNYSVYSQTVQPQSKPHSRPANAGFPARHSPPLKAKTCVCGWVPDRAGDVIQITPFYQPVYIEGVDPTYSQLTTNLSPFILLESEFDTRDGIFGLNTSLAMADAGYSDYTLSIESSDKKFNSILTNSSALYSDN
ncbi:beta-galactosidase, partial [bacterium]|nr:beta-galactosidase [bacterium]